MRTITRAWVRCGAEMSDRGLIGDLRDRLSSFRTRLRLFFVLIVIVPMVAVTFIVFRLIGESENGQADARVAARQEAAIGLYYDARASADRVAARIGRDPALARALRTADRTQIQTVARRLLVQTEAKRIAISRDSAVWADVGDPTASFPATRSLVANGTPVADLQVSVQRAQDYARLVTRTTRMETIVRRNGRVIASTIARPGGVALPEHTGEVTVGGRRFRVASFSAPGFLGERIQVSILEPTATTEHDIRQGRLVAGLVLLGFFLLALISAIVVSRSLNRQDRGLPLRRAAPRRGGLLG